jgi:PAT family beta-lactamase induction signal transducer AmpG
MAGAGRSVWAWIPTLYFGQAIPNAVATVLATVMYKTMGVSNAELALYTGWLYLPWVIKPLWSPLVELLGTKRRWIIAMQLVVGAALALVPLTTHLPHFVQLSLALLWLMAFSSATHDIAADGFYMLALPQNRQAAFVGVRSTFFKFGTIAGQGGLVYLAGRLTEASGDAGWAWGVVFGVLAALFLLLCAYHWVMLPWPEADLRHQVSGAAAARGTLWRDVAATFVSFFQKPGIVVILGFILLFRLGEAQLLKMAGPFMLDPIASGGLGMSTAQVGLAYGTVGVSGLILGGVLGGLLVSRYGLKRCLWPMLFAVHLPDLVFVYLAAAQPNNLLLIAACLAVEQFGYGVGMAGYLLFMIMVADGPNKTAHYAICTGFMALGLMLPSMLSGWIQQQLGYLHFFIWACLSTLPGLAMTRLVRIDAGFGKKQ